MPSYLKYGLSVLLLCVYVFSSNCYVDDPSQNPGELLPFSSIEGVFDLIGSDSQFFTEDPSSDIVLTGEEGTVITIPANSLLDQNGNPVTGQVDITLKEILDKRQMVLNNAPTTSTLDLLESGGELFLSARQNGEELFFEGLLNARIPLNDEISAPDQMEVFYADNSLLGEVVWWPALDSSKAVAVNGAIELAFSQFNWINADYFYDTSLPRTSVSLNPTGASISDGIGFLVFKDINAVMRMRYSSGSLVADKVPVGMEVDAILIGMDPKNLFLGIQSITITDDLSTGVPINFTTVDLIRQLVLDLP